MAWSLKQQREIPEFVATININADNETIQNAKNRLIEASQEDAGKQANVKVAQSIARAFATHDDLPQLYAFISELNIKTRLRCLARMVNKGVTKQTPQDYVDRANQDIESFIDEQVQIGTEDAQSMVDFLSRDTKLPKNQYRKVMQAAKQSLLKALKSSKPKLELKERIVMDSPDEFTIEDNWQICRMSLERSTGSNYTTVDLTLEDKVSQQPISSKSRTSEDVDKLLSHIKKAKFKQTEKNNMREWIYYTFERSASQK